MNKLVKEVEFGKYKFKVAINRDIACKVAETFPEFIVEILNSDENITDMKTAIKNGKIRDLLEKTDYISEECGKIVNYALPFMLEEAEETSVDAEKIIAYAIENEAYDLFSQKMWEFILLGFTNNGVAKTPKVTFKMK